MGKRSENFLVGTCVQLTVRYGEASSVCCDVCSLTATQIFYATSTLSMRIFIFLLLISILTGPSCVWYHVCPQGGVWTNRIRPQTKCTASRQTHISVIQAEVHSAIRNSEADILEVSVEPASSLKDQIQPGSTFAFVSRWCPR